MYILQLPLNEDSLWKRKRKWLNEAPSTIGGQNVDEYPVQ